jgi:hypothetical protein
MKRALLVLIATALLLAAQSQFQFPVFTSGRLQWISPGPTLVVNPAGQIDALIPPPVPGPAGPAGPTGPQGPPGVARPRVYDQALVYNTALGIWSVPATAANVVVYVNGIRYHLGTDYQINAGTIKALGNNMQPGFLITVDYDQ